MKIKCLFARSLGFCFLNRPFAWFTDIKADTFAVSGMEETWKSFKENTWMSFWCKAGDGDTLMLNFLVLSKGHKINGVL